MVGAIFMTDTEHGSRDYFYTGEDANDLITQFNEDQNLTCLPEMGRSMGTRKDKIVLKKLDAFLTNYYRGELTMDDLKDFSVNLSIGYIGVRAIAETEEEVEKLERKLKDLF